MTRTMLKNMSAWFKRAFSSKIFTKKPTRRKRKARTPKTYYRTKARQQLKSLRKAKSLRGATMKKR